MEFLMNDWFYMIFDNGDCLIVNRDFENTKVIGGARTLHDDTKQEEYHLFHWDEVPHLVCSHPSTHDTVHYRIVDGEVVRTMESHPQIAAIFNYD